MRIDPGDFGKGSHLPEVVLETMTQSYACEFSVLNGRGAPLTYAIAAYPGADSTLDVSVGLIFPRKAELARKDPRVCVSFCQPTHLGMKNPPVVVVKGHAAVRDSDLQGNTDRYVQVLQETLPKMFGRIPMPVMRRLGFYLARIWISVTPLQISWWPRDLQREPKTWHAPGDVVLPESDPPPRPDPSNGLSKFRTPADWRPGLARAIEELGPPALTVVDADGFPFTVPTLEATSQPEGALLRIARTIPVRIAGPASLTFHTFAMKNGMPSQENRSFAGTAMEGPEGPLFEAQRQLVTVSLAKPSEMVRAFTNIWRMRGRLDPESERRGQPIPSVTV